MARLVLLLCIMIATPASISSVSVRPDTVNLTVRDIADLCPGCIRIDVIHPDDLAVRLAIPLTAATPGRSAGAWSLPISELVRDLPAECLTEACAGRLSDLVEVVAPASSRPAVLLAGADLNAASAEELVHHLDGVGQRLAERIVEYRQAAGPFTSPADLARVPGVGPRLFEKITGLSSGKRHRPTTREKALRVVGQNREGVLDLREVATRFRELDGFDGCLLVDHDGDLVASSWAETPHEAIGVFAPQLIRKLDPYLKSIDGGQVDMVSIFVSGRPFTLIPFGTLILIAVHENDRFSRAQLDLAKQVATTLSRELFASR